MLNKYLIIIGGIIIYILTLVFISYIMYKNSDPDKIKVSDEEYKEFIMYINNRARKINKRNKKK
jgi:hypothetical protein